MSLPLATFASLLFSSALLELFSWPSIFALSVVLAALALAGTLAVVPTSRDPERAAIDPAGAAGWLMKALKLEEYAPRRDSGERRPCKRPCSPTTWAGVEFGAALRMGNLQPRALAFRA